MSFNYFFLTMLSLLYKHLKAMFVVVYLIFCFEGFFGNDVRTD